MKCQENPNNENERDTAKYYHANRTKPEKNENEVFYHLVSKNTIGITARKESRGTPGWRATAVTVVNRARRNSSQASKTTIPPMYTERDNTFNFKLIIIK